MSIFLVMAFTSFRALPDGDRSPRPLVLLVSAVVIAPATLALNALEYRAIAKAAGHRVSLTSAAQVSLAASLANLLPVPGAVAVRTAALKRQGSSIASAVSVNAIAGAIWVGVTALAVGLALLAGADYVGRGAVAVAAGAAIIAGSTWALRRRNRGWRRLSVELIIIETGSMLAAALRVGVGFAAIGQAISVAAVVTISAAQVIASAIGIFPGGLGLREAIAGGLAATVDVAVSASVAASAVDRVAVQVGMALCAPALGVHIRNIVRRANEGGGEDDVDLDGTELVRGQQHGSDGGKELPDVGNPDGMRIGSPQWGGPD
jgi:uncharacterized membrane protein YbhN (UPF0104 family)